MRERVNNQRVVSIVCALAVLGGLGFIAISSGAKTNFVKDCFAKDAGTWNWGEAPSGCEANRFGDVSRIKYIYKDFVFDRTATDEDGERKSYVTNVQALLRDLAKDYFKTRKPQAQEDEISAFQEAIRAVANQESYWSHYRVGKDGNYKLMTGDRNISHGMMQINQKYHASKDNDNSFDIVGNLSFGIEHFYEMWERASQSRCIHQKKNQSRSQTLLNITRAAYSAYNGGGDALCRWTNPKHPWAINDKNYLLKLTQKEWAPWVTDSEKKVGIDLSCIRSGDDLCAIAKDRRGEYLADHPLLLEDGSTCIVSRDKKRLECARDLRVFTCLAALSDDLKTMEPLKISAQDPDVRSLRRVDHDNRIDMCRTASAEMREVGRTGLAVVGDVIILKKDIAVRKQPGSGAILGYAKKGLGFQVIDMEGGVGPESKRFYRIKLSSKSEGWLEAGTEANQEKALSVHEMASLNEKTQKNITHVIPAVGSEISIVKKDGIKVLSAPTSADGGRSAAVSSEAVFTAAAGSVLRVDEIVYRGAANEIWLKVSSDQEKRSGFLYSGHTFPASTVSDWVKVK